MQKRYLIDMVVSKIEGQTHRLAQSHGYYLVDARDSAKSYGIGEEKRFDVVRLSDYVPIALVGLTQQHDGTHLLVTDEPHSERQGESFEHDAFSDFADLLIASLDREWKVVVID